MNYIGVAFAIGGIVSLFSGSMSGVAVYGIGCFIALIFGKQRVHL